MTEQEFKIKVLSLSKIVFPHAKRLLVSNEKAHDAIQHSMMKLWENRNKLDNCTNLKAFVFRVVRNVCLDELKRKKPLFFDNPANLINHPQCHSGGQEERDEIVVIVQNIIDSLPEDQRQVIQMRDIDGLDFEEIAEFIERGIPYTRVLLSRARKSVKEKIEKIYAYEAKHRD